MRRAGLIRLLIFAVVLAVFGRLCVAEFTWWDDPGTIHQNPAMNPPTLGGIGSYWTAWGAHSPLGLYIPLTYSAWGALAKIAYLQNPDELGIHLNPWVFHSANVVAHAVAALIVFAILRLVIRRDWPAAAGALLFGLHPVQVEAVGWVSGLKDVLSGVLSLLAIWQYLRYAFVRDVITEEPSRWNHYALATLALAAAMLSKPSAMVTPLMALSLDVLVIRGRIRDIVFSLAPWFALSVVCAISAKLAQPAFGVPVAPLWAGPLIAMDSLAFYLWKLFVPINLAVDYGRTPIAVMKHGWLWWTWAAPAAVAALLLIYRKRHPLLLAGGIIFVSGVLPVLGFTPFLFQYFSGVADHYLYLSMLGPAMAGAYLVSSRPARWAAPASTAVLLLLGLLTIRQAGFWHDDIVLWTHVIQVNPRSFLAYNNRGAPLYRRGQVRAAENDFRRAIALGPDYAIGHDNLALVLAATGRVPESIAEIAKVLEVSESAPPALRPARLAEDHNLLGMVLLKNGKYEKAQRHFQRALQLNPQLNAAKQNLETTSGLIKSPTTRP